MVHSITDLLWEWALIANVLPRQICSVSGLECHGFVWRQRDNVRADASASAVSYAFLINPVHYEKQNKTLIRSANSNIGEYPVRHCCNTIQVEVSWLNAIKWNGGDTLFQLANTMCTLQYAECIKLQFYFWYDLRLTWDQRGNGSSYVLFLIIPPRILQLSAKIAYTNPRNDFPFVVSNVNG